MTISSAFSPGDIVIVEFPFSDGSASKDRPALILAGPTVHSDYTVAMISREKQDDGVPIAAADFSFGNLATASHVRIRKLYTLAEFQVLAKRGALKPAAIGRILSQLCPALGCKS